MEEFLNCKSNENATCGNIDLEVDGRGRIPHDKAVLPCHLREKLTCDEANGRRPRSLVTAKHLSGFHECYCKLVIYHMAIK